MFGKMGYYTSYMKGINTTPWKIIMDSFRDFKLCISLHGHKLEWFTVGQGIPMYSKPEHELEEVENRIAKAYKTNLDAQKHWFKECSNEPHDFFKRLL